MLRSEGWAESFELGMNTEPEPLINPEPLPPLRLYLDTRRLARLRLKPLEFEVLTRILAGVPTREIAIELNKSAKMVESYRKTLHYIFGTIESASPVALVMVLLREQYLFTSEDEEGEAYEIVPRPQVRPFAVTCEALAAGTGVDPSLSSELDPPTWLLRRYRDEPELAEGGGA